MRRYRTFIFSRLVREDESSMEETWINLPERVNNAYGLDGMKDDAGYGRRSFSATGMADSKIKIRGDEIGGTRSFS